MAGISLETVYTHKANVRTPKDSPMPKVTKSEMRMVRIDATIRETSAKE
jgi:hypothetical protein